MLQQTQVARVLPYYEAFIDAFPNSRSLSLASGAEVLRMWQGLGYNRRAIYLKRCCDRVETQFTGRFPTSVSDLQALPGIGAYTARAVACFAFEAHVAVVETNVRKAIRYFVDRTGDESQEYSVDSVAESLVPMGNAWVWNQAMIDFGALYVPPRAERLSTTSHATFRSTDRFWRGRIIATLCAYPEPVTLRRLLHELPSERDEYRVRNLISTMEHEGLLTIDPDQDVIALP